MSDFEMGVFARRAAQTFIGQRLRGLAWISALLFLAPRAAAGLLVVDASGGGQFTDISAAVSAAHDGDVILVRAGNYLAFTIDGKSLRVLADTGADVEIWGSVIVKNLPANHAVVLGELKSKGVVHFPISDPGLSLMNNLGFVRGQGCTFRGGKGATSGGCSPGTSGTGGDGVVIVSCTRVAFVGCHFEAGFGFGDTYCSSLGGIGGSGGTMSASQVALYDCFARGGGGGDTDYYPGDVGGRGGQGWRVLDQMLFASRTSFRGGTGGSGRNGGDGGDGLEVEASAQAHLVSSTFDAGYGGYGDGGTNGHEGEDQSGSGLFHSFSNYARVFSAPLLLADTGTLAVTVYGQPGDRVWILSGALAHHFTPALAGVRLVKVPLWTALDPEGIVPASGLLNLQIPVPDLSPGTATSSLFLQGYVIDASGSAFLGSPMHPTILNCGSLLPDCNGDAQFDSCDILNGVSNDCNGNGIPDECEIDCNGNGVPDSCDISQGTSHDLNRNGIPDECEAHGVTWYVDASAPAGGNGSAAFPFRAIGEGIAPAVSGDTVMVAGGTYVGAANRNLKFGGRDLVVRSANGPASCVIDCQSTGYAFSIDQGETSAARIEGFTIMNGYTVNGGGAISVYVSNASVFNCVFMSCHASSGGGLSLSFTDSEVKNCTFVGNVAQAGGGLLVDCGKPKIHHCLLQGNTAIEGGGGVYINNSYDSLILLSHCTVLGNHSSSLGGGIYLEAGGPHNPNPVRIDHCLIAGNTAVKGSAVWCAAVSADILDSTVVDNAASTTSAMFCQGNVDMRFVNSILWHNTSPDGRQATLFDAASRLTVAWSDFEGGQAAVFVAPGASMVWGASNISLDPMFADPDGPDNNASTWLDNDYRLAFGSACIDAADNFSVPADVLDLDADGDTIEPVPFDLDGNPRFQDDPATVDTGNGSPPIVDMGAYEKRP